MEKAKTLKKHMMFGKHLGVPGKGRLARFTADPETAFLWGEGLKRKLTRNERNWLQTHLIHELSERMNMAKGMPYRKAHLSAENQPGSLQSFLDWLDNHPKMKDPID